MGRPSACLAPLMVFPSMAMGELLFWNKVWKNSPNAVDSDVTKRFSDEGMEPKVMVLTHEIIPSCSFVREN